MKIYHVLRKVLVVTGMLFLLCDNVESEIITIQTDSDIVVVDISDVSAIRFDGEVSAEAMQLLVPIFNARLFQNHPNPFNPETTISFELEKDPQTPVILTIFNAKGQKVTTLIKENLPAGKHDAVWNGEDDTGKTVSSGIYFYQLSFNSDQSTKKMILLK